MSAKPAGHVDMALDTNNAVSLASSELTTEPVATVPVADADARTVSIDASSSSTTSHRKEPPPEKPSDVRRRTLVILSFWLIVLCLGLPIWWKTTAIPRANLPLDEMMDWADGKVCCHVLCFDSLALCHFVYPKSKPAALTVIYPGLPTRLSPTHLHPGKPASGARGPEPIASGPARP